MAAVTPLSQVERQILASAPKPVPQGHAKKISSLCWNSTGDTIATGSGDSVIKLWSVDKSGQCKASSTSLRGHAGTIDGLAFSPLEPHLLASGSTEKAVRLWDTRSGKPSNTIMVKGQPLTIVWCPDGSGLAVGGRDDSLSLIDARKGKVSATVQFAQELNEFAITPEGLLYTALVQRGVSDEGFVGIYKLQSDMAGIASVARVSAHTGTVLQLKFSPDFKTFVTGSADSIVGIWDAEEAACVRVLDRADSQIRALSFSHSGEHLVIAAGDREDTNAATKTLDIVSATTATNHLTLSHIVLTHFHRICSSSQVRVRDGTRIKMLQLPQNVNAAAWAPHAPIIAFAIDDQRLPQGTAFDAGCVRIISAL
jgi:THO complex subunit 3